MIYDPFQEKAIDFIKEGHSVIVSAPTGAGKTAIAEYVINDCIEKNDRVIYTAPIKALSNQKFRDFQEVFKNKIGITTGDVSINPRAPVLIMTTEIFRNKLLEKEGTLDDYKWIIFDEIHYLDDYERGTVWEESLIFLPRHMRVLALSATIPNINELADWIQSVHKRSFKVIVESKRPVPLHFFYQYQGRTIDDIKKIKKTRQDYGTKPNRPSALVRELNERNRLPCIYFVFGRKRCEYLAEEMRGFNFLNSEESEKITSLFNKLSLKFALTGEKSAVMIKPLVERGIAYHHAGMLPTLKEVIERLFTSRLIKVIFTTETFALGINMPARTVIFDELRKYYGQFFSALKTRDFYQMAGRAGRRGIDKEGFVYSRVNPRYTSFQEVKRIIYGQPEKVSSRFNASYATILNLYEKYKEKLYDIYPLSFHYFQKKEHVRKGAMELLRSKMNILKEYGYIASDRLTQKGVFAGKVYGYELSLSEVYDMGVLEGLSEHDLATLALGLVFEPRKGTQRPHFAKNVKRLHGITDGIIQRIHKDEKALSIRPLSKAYYYNLSPCLDAWMKKEKFDKLLRYTNVDEGEIIRYFRMCIQILREILDTPVSEGLKEKAERAVDLINRDIIDAERQLRE